MIPAQKYNIYQQLEPSPTGKMTKFGRPEYIANVVYIGIVDAYSPSHAIHLAHDWRIFRTAHGLGKFPLSKLEVADLYENRPSRSVHG